MENKKGKEEKCEGKRMNKIIIGIVSAVILVAVVVTVGVGYKKNVMGKGYANNDVNEIEGNIENEAGKNGEIKTVSNGTSNENDLGIKLSNYVIAGSEEARKNEEILKKVQKEKEKIEKNKEKSKSTKYAGVSEVQLVSNAGNTRDIKSAVQEIAEKNISTGELTLSQNIYEYNGQRNTPDPTLTVNGKELILGKDYTIEYTNNINAGIGTATATAKGINDYTGTKTASFTITSVPITVKWLEEKNEFAYDGQEHMPEIESPIIYENGDRIYLDVKIEEDKKIIDAGTYKAVAEIKSIELGQRKDEPGAITVTSKITMDSAGSSVAGNNVTKGTKLYIQITASQENGEIKSIYSDYNKEKKESTATYSLEITENGTYEFAVVGSENTSKWCTVTVNNYVEAELEVGDYVQYMSDIGTSATWRVWKIEEGTGNVVITPVNGIGSLKLNGSTGNDGWVNAETAIENECDKYISTNLGVTKDDIKSMTINDIENILPADEVTKAKHGNEYGSEYTSTSDWVWAEKANGSSGTFDGYNKALSTDKLGSTLVNTYWYKNNPTWNSLENTKTEMMSDTYGTILGTNNGWLVSRCIDCHSGITYNVYYVASNNVKAYTLYETAGSATSHGITYKVRPLITLDSTLFKTGGGTSSNPWKLSK